MLTQRALVVGRVLQVFGSLKAIPGVTKADETIDGFPEFAFTVDTIPDPEVKKKLKAIAKRIVASHSGPNRIIGFEIHGHADQTVRIAAGAERDRAELEVSRDRAENAKELLLQMIRDEPGGTPIIAGIEANADAAGFGSNHRIFKPATSDPQMRRNRRVEIFLREFIPPPPKPSPAPPPQPNPSLKHPWRIQIQNGTVMTVQVPGLDVSSLNITLVVEITDLKRHLKARYRVVSTGGAAQSIGFPPIPSPVDTQQVLRGKPLDFTTNNEATLAAFAGAVDVGLSPGAGVSVLSAGGQFAFSFTDLEKLGRFTQPSIVVAEGGSSPLQLPQASLGGFTTGKISMQGAPTAAP